MSGLNKKTGWYELTFVEAHRFYGAKRGEVLQMAEFANALRAHKIKVGQVYERWLEVKPPRAKVHAVISLMKDEGR